MSGKTPIVLISGSLGAGKTTLLDRILRNSGRRLAVVMNEFGEIAIDSEVIRGESIEIIELAGGCVCCSLTGEFEAAVREIIGRAQPELVVVEATGVAESDALVLDIEENLPEARLESVICIVDAYLTVKYPHVGYTTRIQLEAADIVLVNKQDLVSPEELAEVEKKIREFNKRAVILKTTYCDFDINTLLGLDLERSSGLRVKRLEEHGFQSFSFKTTNVLDENKFQRLVSDLPDSVFRAKGLVRFAAGGRLFNYVVGRSDLVEFPVEQTRLVFIGKGLASHREAILHQLAACEVQNAV